jgi:hypothetical protein
MRNTVTMNNSHQIIDTLRQYLGEYVSYQGTVYEIIEVLEEYPALVLQDCEEHTTIQADQHGEAHRRVPQTHTIPIPINESGQYDISGLGIELIKHQADG